MMSVHRIYIVLYICGPFSDTLKTLVFYSRSDSLVVKDTRILYSAKKKKMKNNFLVKIRLRRRRSNLTSPPGTPLGGKRVDEKKLRKAWFSQKKKKI